VSGYVILLSAAIVATLIGQVRTSNLAHRLQVSTAADAARIHRAQIAGCQRQNLRTAAANRNALATWRLDTLFVADLVRVPHRATRAQRKETAEFTARLKDTLTSLTWTPVNPACDSDPTSVQLPIPFSATQPTRADL
jgi:hypothetical protein